MELLLLGLTALFLFIAWMRFDFAVYLLCALLPSYLLRGVFFGIPTTLLELMILALIIVWLIQNRRRLNELFVVEKRFALMIALWIASATISAIIAPDAIQALGIWKAYFIEPVFIFYLLIDLHRRSQITTENVSLALLTGGLLVALVAIGQWVLWTGIPIPWDFERRVTGVFDYPNALGLYLGPLVIVSAISLLGKSFSSRMNLKTVFVLLCLPTFLLAIFLAKSEAALAATVITLFLIGFCHIKWRKKTVILFLTLMMILFFVPTTRSFFISKISLQDYSGQVRLGQWTETWELIKDHPILGVGLSGYPAALTAYHKQTHIEIFQYPHNIFLNIWVELGLLGLLTFFYLIFLLFPSPLSTTNYKLLTTHSFLLPLLTLFLHGLVDVPYFKNDLAVMTWIFIALIYANSLSKIKQPKQ